LTPFVSAPVVLTAVNSVLMLSWQANQSSVCGDGDCDGDDDDDDDDGDDDDNGDDDYPDGDSNDGVMY
jgi:hypothetical protein